MEALQHFQAHDAFNLILLLIVVLVVYRVIHDPASPIQFWHAFSTKAADGVVYLDIDKVGMLVGLFGSSWVIGWLTYVNKLEVIYFIAWLIYCSGMGAFSKWARGIISNRYSKNGGGDPAAALATAGGTITSSSTVTKEDVRKIEPAAPPAAPPAGA